jgi:hypothetical protein
LSPAGLMMITITADEGNQKPYGKSHVIPIYTLGSAEDFILRGNEPPHSMVGWNNMGNIHDPNETFPSGIVFFHHLRQN